MLDSLVHLLGQVPGRAFPDERRVPQLARQHGRCCSCRIVQVFASIELLRARTRVELQKKMKARNLAFAMILKRSGTLWATRRGHHVSRRVVGKIVHDTSLSVVQLSFCIGCHVRFFVRYTLADIHQCLLKLHQQHVAAEEYPQQAMR